MSSEIRDPIKLRFFKGIVKQFDEDVMMTVEEDLHVTSNR